MVEHRAPVGPQGGDTVAALLRVAQGWRSTRLLCEGVPLPRAALWTLLEVLECHALYRVQRLGRAHGHGLPDAPAAAVGCRVVTARLRREALGGDAAAGPVVAAWARATGLLGCPAFDLARGTAELGAAPDTERSAFEALLGDLRLDLDR